MQLELISAPPAELERLLLEQRRTTPSATSPVARLRSITSRCSTKPNGCIAARDTRCSQLCRCRRRSCSKLTSPPPYRFLKAGEPFQSRRSSALAEQIDSALTFILSGRHIGYLPSIAPRPGRRAGCYGRWIRAWISACPLPSPGIVPKHRVRRSKPLPKTCGRPSPESFGGLCTEGLSTPAPFCHTAGLIVTPRPLP